MDKQLFLGSGKEVRIPPFFELLKKEDITTLDINPDRDPDIIWDLNQHPLPFDDESFDQIFAFETLEHLGSLGDYRFFFKEFEEYWRILKKDGLFIASVPTMKSPWAFGDPGHTRYISKEMLGFLNQKSYENAGPTNPISDYRFCYKANFEIAEHKYYYQDWIYVFILKKREMPE